MHHFPSPLMKKKYNLQFSYPGSYYFIYGLLFALYFFTVSLLLPARYPFYCSFAPPLEGKDVRAKPANILFAYNSYKKLSKGKA